MHVQATLLRPCCVRAAVVSLLWVVGTVSAAPAPEPTPKYDVTASPITADELAEELGYKFYGNTWKFSAPTYARVRVWSMDGSVAKVPDHPPESAEWEDVYAPDKPQTEMTIHVLEKTDKTNMAAEGSNDHKSIEMHFSISAAGKDAPGDQPSSFTIPSAPGVVVKEWNTSGSESTSLALELTQGPHQAFNTESRHANADFGVMFQSLGKVIDDAAAHPDQAAKPEEAEATIRGDAEARLHAAPLNVWYFKGEVCGMTDEDIKKDAGGAFKVPRKRAVCLVTLECSREPFKDDAAASSATSTAGAKVASDH